MGRVSLLKRLSMAIKIFRSDDPGYGDKWYEVYPGSKTLSGTRINETSALTVSALFAALNFLASTMASLPKVILRKLPDGGREHAVNHPLYDRLHNKPNDEGLDDWQYIYASIMHKYLWGNWYTYIDHSSYQNQQLFPLLPERMERYDPQKREYIYRLPNGFQRIFPQASILHIPHISMDGIQGKGIIHYARESLGLARAQDEFAARFFGSGIKAGGFVEVPAGSVMNEETRKGLQEDFNKKYGELGESWKAIFLSGGAEWKPNEIDAQKAQALESRQFTIVEVARWCNLPPHILRDLAKATFSNIEEQSLELVKYSILPLAVQIEHAMNIVLFDDTERRTHYIKFDLRGLERGDLAARTAFYTAMLDRGVFNADTVLELEDMNPQPGGLGQAYVLPLNMVNKKMITGSNDSAFKQMGQMALPMRTVRMIEARSATLRRRTTLAWTPKFEEMAQKIIRTEITAVRKAIKETLGEREIGDFEIWLDSFYNEFPAKVEQHAAPVLSGYATAILPIAQEEAANDADISLGYADFQRHYREAFAIRHVVNSRQQLGARIREAQTAGKNEREALEAQLDEWEDKRPGKIVGRETIQAENAFTRSVFALCGIMKIVSIASGNSCPYCSALDGKVIGIDENFLSAGEFQPEGADAPLKISSDHKHPPYHAGCMCSIGIST